LSLITEASGRTIKIAETLFGNNIDTKEFLWRRLIRLFTLFNARVVISALFKTGGWIIRRYRGAVYGFITLLGIVDFFAAFFGIDTNIFLAFAGRKTIIARRTIGLSSALRRSVTFFWRAFCASFDGAANVSSTIIAAHFGHKALRTFHVALSAAILAILIWGAFS